jgi:hypothetical protein
MTKRKMSKSESIILKTLCRKLKIGKCSGRISSSRSTTGTILQTRINYGDKQFNLIANLVLKIIG